MLFRGDFGDRSLGRPRFLTSGFFRECELPGRPASQKYKVGEVRANISGSEFIQNMGIGGMGLREYPYTQLLSRGELPQEGS